MEIMNFKCAKYIKMIIFLQYRPNVVSSSIIYANVTHGRYFKQVQRLALIFCTTRFILCSENITLFKYEWSTWLQMCFINLIYFQINKEGSKTWVYGSFA